MKNTKHTKVGFNTPLEYTPKPFGKTTFRNTLRLKLSLDSSSGIPLLFLAPFIIYGRVRDSNPYKVGRETPSYK